MKIPVTIALFLYRWKPFSTKYEIPMHLQDCFSYLGHKPGRLPVAEEAAQKTLVLPIYPELTVEQQEYVVDSIKAFYVK